MRAAIAIMALLAVHGWHGIAAQVPQAEGENSALAGPLLPPLPASRRCRRCAERLWPCLQSHTILPVMLQWKT
jgi:hypothetical protein